MTPFRLRVDGNRILATAAAAFAVVLGGCATPRTTGPAPAPAPVVAGKSPLASAERLFLVDVAAKGMYEVEVSRLSVRRAVDARVRAYAEGVVAYHEQASRELVALMSAKGVAPPSRLAARSESRLHRLAALPPSADFDKGYVRVVGIEEHASDIALLERMRRDARDPDVRAWVERALPQLRRQLTLARDLAKATGA